MKGDAVHLTFARVMFVSSAAMVMLAWLGASSSHAQNRLTSLEELRRALAAGDFITVVPADGRPIIGRLVRFGDTELDVRPDQKPDLRERTPRDVSIPLSGIHSLERPRDSPRNGVLIGAGIGAGFGGALFAHALAVDRNEIDEWAGFYAVGTAVCVGIGALIGWVTDAARSKPYIRYEASSAARMSVRVRPAYSPGRRVALVLSVSN
jgi:HAMP domain-containing protein